MYIRQAISCSALYFSLVFMLFFIPFITFGDGLPGEFVISQRWRDLTSSYSPVTNPALLTETNYSSVRFVFSPVMQGEFKLYEIGLTVPIALYHSFGVSAVIQDDGPIEIGGYDNNTGQLIPGQGTSSNQTLFSMFSLASQVWSRLSVGVNITYAYQTNFGSPLMGLGLDIGSSYRLLNHSFFGEHLAAIATQNLLAPSMSSSPLPKFGNRGTYSRDLRLSYSSYFNSRSLESSFDFDIKDFVVSAKEFEFEKGLYSSAKKIEWDLSYRAGVTLLKLLKLYIQLGFDKSILDYWGASSGVTVPSANFGRELSFLYQFTFKTASSDASNHSFYFKADLGKHREEIFARRMSRLISVSPNDLYTKARTLYTQERYWDAHLIFSQILVEFPDFFNNDWVNYYKASCLEHMDMRELALKSFEQNRKKYSTSRSTPYTDLSMLRIAYRMKNSRAMSEHFENLSKKSVPDSLRYHGIYLMGQSSLQVHKYSQAIKLFSEIPTDHPDYIFSQHAVAIAYAQFGGKLTPIITALENCIGSRTITAAQREIAYRSYLFLGYLFYETNAISKAVVAFRMIPINSTYAEDALLGQGWTALKAKQWNDCIITGKLLARTSKKDILQCEGMLIQAYGYLQQKEYTQSTELLKNALQKTQSVLLPNKETMDFEKMNYESNRLGYSFLAEKIETLSMKGLLSTSTQTDSLHSAQINFVEKFNNYHSFTDQFKRLSFFSRNITLIKDDIQFALATSQRLLSGSGLVKEQKKIDEKQNEIDAEIEKLKKEMELLQKKVK